MSILAENGLTLPDAPEDILATHPYCAVIEVGDDTEMYIGLICCTSAMVYVPMAVSGNSFDILAGSTGDSVLVSYTLEGEAWAEGFMLDMGGTILILPSEDGVVCAPCWSNHDIFIVVGVDVETGLPMIGTDVYYAKTQDQSKQYWVTLAWLTKMGNHARRLTGISGKRTMETVDSDLASIPYMADQLEQLEVLKSQGAFLTFHSDSDTVDVTIPKFMREFVQRLNFTRVTEIPEYYFRTDWLGSELDQTANIKEVDFPTVTTLGHGAFWRNTKIEKVSFASVVDDVSNSVFEHCTALKSVSFPSMTEAGYDMFFECSALTEITRDMFPELVTPGSGMFRRCSNIKRADLPKLAVKTSYLFSECPALKALVVRSETVMDTGGCTFGSSFHDTPILNGKGVVFVARALVDTYRNHGTFGAAENGVSPVYQAVEDYTVDGTLTGDMEWDRVDAYIATL